MPSSDVASQSLNLCPIVQAQRLGFLKSMLIIAPKLTDSCFLQRSNIGLLASSGALFGFRVIAEDGEDFDQVCELQEQMTQGSGRMSHLVFTMVNRSQTQNSLIVHGKKFQTAEVRAFVFFRAYCWSNIKSKALKEWHHYC